MASPVETQKTSLSLTPAFQSIKICSVNHKFLGLVHKRSFDKLKRRIIRDMIFKNAYIDKYRGEIVSRISRLDVLGLLNVKLQCLPYSRRWKRWA